jgi:hypothetical protein
VLRMSRTPPTDPIEQDLDLVPVGKILLSKIKDHHSPTPQG